MVQLRDLPFKYFLLVLAIVVSCLLIQPTMAKADPYTNGDIASLLALGACPMTPAGSFVSLGLGTGYAPDEEGNLETMFTGGLSVKAWGVSPSVGVARYEDQTKFCLKASLKLSDFATLHLRAVPGEIPNIWNKRPDAFKADITFSLPNLF